MKEFRKFFRQYQNFIISSVIFIGIVVGVFVGLLPAFGKIVDMRSELSSLSAKNSSLQTKASLLDSLDEDTYNQYLKELSYAVPTDKSLTSMFTTIDGLSTLTGVTLSDFTLTKPGNIATESAKRQSTEEKKVGSSFLPFTLTVTGTYDQIHKFMEQAINVRRFFGIRFFDITFTRSDTISAHMGMNAYYAPLPTTLGSPSQKIEQLDESDEKVISQVANLPLLGVEPPQNAIEANPAVITGPPRVDPFSP